MNEPTRIGRFGLTARQWSAAAAIGLAAVSLSAHAFESDVHFGLTKWLAQKAGFDESQAEAIAVGNQRVDAGLMDTLELALEYACAGQFVEAAQQVQRLHFPAAKALPAPPDQRAVIPGSQAARQPLAALFKQTAGKEGLLLGKLGEALHTLQDSWSHQGAPGVPVPDATLTCHGELASGHASARQGPGSHAADLTHLWEQDVAAMARASYEVLMAYPPIQGRARQAVQWTSLIEPLARFSRAATKTQKRDWFSEQGVHDTTFLEGISLPDGPQPGPLQWSERKLPALPSAVSTQHDAAPDVRAFFDKLIVRWLSDDAVETVVADMAGGRPTMATGAASGTLDQSMRELVARLKLWKLKDHGAAAALAHAGQPLSPAQLNSVDRLTREPNAYVQPRLPAEALFPLQAKGPHASPLLPYIVRSLPAQPLPRVIAIARLKHAPYDTVGWIAERQGERWVLVNMIGVVDQ